ncbi:MAG: dynamin family protein, partial [Pseudomonadota bacterium]
MNLEVRKTETTELRKAPRPATLSAGLELLQHFAEDSKRVDEALQTLAALTGNNSAKAVARLRKELAEFEPTITVLGQVKAGKTALVNAMAGWSDLLPSDVNPWTSVVTSLHLKPGESRSENGACFKFMTDDEWERLLNKGGRMGELASRAGAESELQKISEQIEIVRQKARHRLGKKFELLIGQEHDYGYFDKNLLEKYICLGDDFDGDEEVSADQEEQGRFAEIL